MKYVSITAVMLFLVLSCLPIIAAADDQQAGETAQRSELRVGTFDSRAVALAYYRSDAFKKQINEQKAEHAKAKQEGNETRAEELETKGQTQQELAHKQGFGTWPVDDLLEKIKDDIVKIAEEANVDVIVSKWDVVYQAPNIEFVDVTDLIVKPFKPDKDTLKTLEELKKVDPVPLEELEGHDH